MMFAIKTDIVLTPYRMLKEAYVLIEKEKIVGFSRYRPEGLSEVRRYDDRILAPGLVDIHVHGGFGIDLTYSTTKEILDFSRKLLMTGVTSYVPSTVTDSTDRIENALRNIHEASGFHSGSRILGVHLEGPYLNPERSGAQSKEHIRKPSLEEFERFYDASGKLVKRVTVAPEVDNGIDFIRAVIEKFGVKVSLGHTDATYEQTLGAIKAGANIITHLFNGMRGYHHREPGIIGAALTTDVYAEIIVDFIHLHPATVALTIRCKSPSRTILVSDATPGAGLPNGVYMLGPSKVIIRDGVARTEEGVLAGSTLMLMNAVRNVVKMGLPLNDAFRMATSTPCDAMGIRGVGRIARGCRADLLILNKQLEIEEIYFNGEIYESD